jgi:hypothetical protein
VATPDRERAVEQFERLGLSFGDELQFGVGEESLSARLNETGVDLLTPENDGEIQRYLDENGPGLYGLALRVMGQSWIEKVQSQALPTNDRDFLDSYGLDPVTKAARYAELLRQLPVGLSEWAVHPGLDNAELLAIDPGGARIRQADYDFFTSQQAKDIIKKEGIILLDYRPLQEVWREKGMRSR